MRLPSLSALPRLFAKYSVAAVFRVFLAEASRTLEESDARVERGEQTRADPTVRAQWQAAESFWMAAGAMAPIAEWPWVDLATLVGPFMPGEVWVLGARTGEGKSTMVTNLIPPLTQDGKLRITVAPLEESPAIRMLRLACLVLGYNAPAVFRRQWWKLPVPETEARVNLQTELARYAIPPMRDLVRYCPEDTLDRAGMQRVITQAAEWNHKLVIFDHLHQMDHGDGPENRGIRLTMRMAKQLARRYDLAVLFTAQLGRGDVRDRTRKFYPPELSDLQGASAIEQLADAVLLAYQPLNDDVKAKDIDEVVKGRREYRSIIRPNTIGVVCAKHRLDGEARARSVVLRFNQGRISNLTPDWLQPWNPEVTPYTPGGTDQ